MKNHNPAIRVLFTGGHLTPAVATIAALKRHVPNVIVHFVGRKSVFDTTDITSHEKETIEHMGVSFLPLTTGRLMRAGLFVDIVSSLIKVPIGFIMAFWYVLNVRPDVVVSFGGYIAVPVVLAAWILAIPIITHEQTHTIGLGTKIIAFFADVVCVSDRKQMRLFPFVRVVYTGLPLRDRIVEAVLKKRIRSKKRRPSILITGGTSGAVSINAIVYQALPELLVIADVLHQVGRTSIQQALRVQKALPVNVRHAYTVVEYMDEKAYRNALLASDVIVGRSGANTVAEIATLGKSAIFIPLPWASYDEQHKNAQVLEKAGSATIIRQERVTPEILVAAVKDHIVRRDIFETSGTVFAKDMKVDGADALAHEIISLGKAFAV